MSRVQPSASGIVIDRLIEQAKHSAVPVEAPVRGEEMVVVVLPQRDYEQWRAIREAKRRIPARPSKTLAEYLAETKRTLRRYEKKYKMTSAEFYRRFQAAELPEKEEFFDWRVEYNAFRNMKKRIANVKR
ncbi:MAG: hypothetical protein KGJ80_20910 [Chloroflexota bacterium]|nr:hypothetical protein [Chloroflexota bacterium]